MYSWPKVVLELSPHQRSAGTNVLMGLKTTVSFNANLTTLDSEVRGFL